MSDSSNSTIHMRRSSDSFVQEVQDVKPLLVEMEADVKMPYPTASAVLLADQPLSSTAASWKDPFYENDATVIATFTFCYDRIDRGLARTGFCLGGIFLLVVAISLLFPPFLFVLATYPLLFLLCCIALHVSDRYKRHRRRCSHIALTESAIYVDEVSEPGSHELMRRLKYSYSEISKSEVVRTDCCGNVKFSVVLTNSRGGRILQLDDLMGAQTFVDLVNDMIDRVSKDGDQKATSEPTVARALEVF